MSCDKNIVLFVFFVAVQYWMAIDSDVIFKRKSNFLGRKRKFIFYKKKIMIKEERVRKKK